MSKSQALELIDLELERMSIDMNQQPYPMDTKWWMWRKKHWNDGVNVAHQVGVEKLQEIRQALEDES